jgi:hypothetical protein
MDPKYNTVAVQTYTTFGKARIKGQIIGESGADITGNQTVSGAITAASQSLSGNSTVRGRIAVGTNSVDASAMVRIVSDGNPFQFERDSFNLWRFRHTGGDAATGSSLSGFGVYNSSSNKWAWLATEKGTFDTPDKSTFTRTSNYQILAGENGIRFSNRGATGSITLTLPHATAGLHYAFEGYENQTLIIAASSGDTIRNGSTLSASTELKAKGSTLHLYSPGSGEWFIDQKNP